MGQPLLLALGGSEAWRGSPFCAQRFSRRHECFDWRAGSVYAQLYAQDGAVLRSADLNLFELREIKRYGVTCLARRFPS